MPDRYAASELPPTEMTLRPKRVYFSTMPMMMYSKTHVEDLDTTMEDHACDEVRYFCMSRPIKAMRPVARRVILNDPLNQFGG